MISHVPGSFSWNSCEKAGFSFQIFKHSFLICVIRAVKLYHSGILTTPIILLFLIFSRTISNSVKQFKGILCLCITIKSCTRKMPPMRHAFYSHYRQRHSFTQPMQNCQNVLSPISSNLNRLWSN